jgi:ubiquinone/menaquinone biosynthesis C-methylase UbiE
MAELAIRFEDGAAYDRGMGRWSLLAGEVFLDWLAPQPGAQWIDVGCGSGAFTELLYQRCAPAGVQGIDPSNAQLAFARERRSVRDAEFQVGNATALPFVDNRFDAAVMALVIFFVPDPAKGVAEMVRVVRPGGIVAAYAWDMTGGGFPFEPIRTGLRDFGFTALSPPRVDASRIDALRSLWTEAGLGSIETREISVRRTFDDFSDFWTMSTASGSIQPILAAMPADDVERLKQHVQAMLPTDSSGRITYNARANAVKGRVAR